MRYVATINVPGYLPMDDDPPVFDTIWEAWEYLASERREAEEWDPDVTVTEEMASETLEALHQLAIHPSPELGTVWGPTPGGRMHDLGLAYSVSIAEGGE